MVPTSLELPSYKKRVNEIVETEACDEENRTCSANEEGLRKPKSGAMTEDASAEKNISPSILHIRSHSVKEIVNDFESKLDKGTDDCSNEQQAGFKRQQASVLSTCSEFTASFIREDNGLSRETMNLEKLSSLIDTGGEKKGEAIVEDEWILEFTEDSKAYWCNTTTGESRWDLPVAYLPKTLTCDIEKFNSVIPFVGNLHAALEEKSGKLLLHYLAEIGFAEGIDSLVLLDININSQDHTNRTALHYCLECQDLEAKTKTLKRLLSLGCSQRLVDSDGNSPLHIAALRGDKQSAVLLLEQEAFRLGKDFPTFNNSGDSPMHSACKAGASEGVDAMLDIFVEDAAGSWAALYSCTNSKGKLPESCSSSNACRTLIKLRKQIEGLKQNEADLRDEVSRLRQKLLSATTLKKELGKAEPIHREETCPPQPRPEESRSQKASSERDKTTDHESPSEWQKYYTDDGHAFLRHNRTGETKWADATDIDKAKEVWARFFENACSENVQRLTLAGAIKALNVSHVTAALSGGEEFGNALHACCSVQAKTVRDKQNLVEIAATIVDFGADIDGVNDQGRSPLHISAEHGNVILLDFLLKHAASVHRSDQGGNTALHLAASGGTKSHLKCVQLLVKYGSSLVWCNGSGETAADRARMKMVSLNDPPKALCQTVYLLQELAHQEGGQESESPANTFRRHKGKERGEKTKEPVVRLNDSAWSLLPGMSFVKGATSFLLGTSVLEGDAGKAHDETEANGYSTDTSTLHSCIEEEEDFEDCSAPTPPEDVRRAIHKAKLEKSGIYSAV